MQDLRSRDPPIVQSTSTKGGDVRRRARCCHTRGYRPGTQVNFGWCVVCHSHADRHRHDPPGPQPDSSQLLGSSAYCSAPTAADVGSPVLPNKDNGPRAPLALIWRSARCLSSMIWLECRVLEGSQQTPLGASCLEIVGSDGIRSCAPFFPIVRFEEGASWITAICCHHGRVFFCFMVKLETENDMKVGNWGILLVVRVFAAMMNLIGDSRFITVECKWGRHHMRNSMYYLSGWKWMALTSCTWQLPCWRYCFESGDFLHGENIRSMIRRWW
jgi:hypothetical protein